MDRKKTILIAVFINAGLLAVLFIAALTRQEEVAVPSVESASLAKLERPLFPDASALENAGIAPPPIPLPLAEAPKLESKSEETLVHKLPPPAEAPLLSPTKMEPSYREVVVKKGDSLDKIAKAHHTTVDEIIKVNQLPSSFLKAGQVLKIPAEKTMPPAIAKPIVEKATVGGPEYYTVKVGDNPWTIAMKHHMKVEELLKLNQLNEERARKLKPGDRLRIR